MHVFTVNYAYHYDILKSVYLLTYEYTYIYSADTVDGKMEVKIPVGTQPEQKIRIRGKGAPKLGSEVRFKIFTRVY
jgi:DnaJ-class molecular chaperone